ncbi:MAG: amidohydrolase family protein, partial [Bacteroidota bacterium]
MQGVTAISLGQDGSSPPFPNIRYWMDTVEQIGSGVHIIPFVGHGSLRLMSPVRFQRDPAPAAMDSMTWLMEDALRAGVWGLSLGLEYTPGLYAPRTELEQLAKVLAEYDGMIMSHIRNEDDEGVEEALQELLDLGAWVPVHVSHMKSVYGKGPDRARQILRLLGAARKKGYQVTADIYPYIASYTTIGILFPDWARPPRSFGRVMRRREAELDTFLRRRIVRRNGPEATLFGAGPYTGQTLAQVAEAKHKRPERVLMEDIGPTGASAAYFVMDSLLQLELLQDSLTNICSDGSPTMRHPRGYGSFARIIEVVVVQDSVLTLEEAIRKMSALPAQTLGMARRGQIAPGYIADMVLFDPQNIKAHATYAEPHQLATGM